MQNRISIDLVQQACESVIEKLPDFWKEFRLPQVRRIREEISWIYTSGGTVIDLGGSSGFHASVCVELGMKAICVDNFKIRDSGTSSDYFYDQDLEAEEVARSIGVEFIHTDLLTWNPPFPKDSIDVVMSFDNIEHLHHSPRSTYHKVGETLKPGGLFLLGGPNAANLLKRLRVINGKNVFSRFEDWYMYPQFIGHVREPIVADYLAIAKDLELQVVSIAGKNWLGWRQISNPNSIFGNMLQIGDNILQKSPTLCSDIYLLATKK